jgi:hypothetical protein
MPDGSTMMQTEDMSVEQHILNDVAQRRRQAACNPLIRVILDSFPGATLIRLPYHLEDVIYELEVDAGGEHDLAGDADGYSLEQRA